MTHLDIFETQLKSCLSGDKSALGLSDRIKSAVMARRRRDQSVRVVVYSLCAAFFTILGVRFVFSASLVSSEFFQLVSLLFSDFSMVLSFWREYLSSLIEAVRFVPLAAAGAIIWALILTFSQLIKNIIYLTHRSRRASV